MTKSEIKSKAETEESLNQTIANTKKKQINLKNKFMSLANISNELMSNEEYISDKKKIEDEITGLEKRLNTVDNKIEETNDQTYKPLTLLIELVIGCKMVLMRRNEL